MPIRGTVTVPGAGCTRMANRRKHDGDRAEALAARWLAAQGYELLARNVRYRGGEIDLIVRERDVIVFVEVRARRANALVSAAESVTPRKQARLVEAAERWLSKREIGIWRYRFDLVAVTASADGWRLRQIRDAFRAS